MHRGTGGPAGTGDPVSARRHRKPCAQTGTAALPAPADSPSDPLPTGTGLSAPGEAPPARAAPPRPPRPRADHAPAGRSARRAPQTLRPHPSAPAITARRWGRGRSRPGVRPGRRGPRGRRRPSALRGEARRVGGHHRGDARPLRGAEALAEDRPAPARAASTGLTLMKRPNVCAGTWRRGQQVGQIGHGRGEDAGGHGAQDGTGRRRVGGRDGDADRHEGQRGHRGRPPPRPAPRGHGARPPG